MNRVVQAGRRVGLGAALWVAGGGSIHNPMDNRAGGSDDKARNDVDIEKVAAPIQGM